MSFHLRSENLRLDEGHILRGRLRAEDGNLVDAEINLDDCLGNLNGMFHWGERGFSGSAKNISFSIEGGGEVPVLRAELSDQNDQTQTRDVNLAERIVNRNGRLVFE